jgi:hypothetical protein
VVNVRKVLIIVAIVLALAILTGGGAVVVSHVTRKKSEKDRLEQLLPHVRAKLEALIARLAAKGLHVYVGSTARDEAEQAALVAGGKSTTNNSWHRLRRAVDLYPIDPLTNEPDLAGHNLELFRKMHAEAKALGFVGLAFNNDGSVRYLQKADGKKFWDGGHLQWTDGMTFAQAETDLKKKGVA